MKIGGCNNCSQLDEKSNAKGYFGGSCISPPRDSPLNVSSLSSFSMYSDHSVGVTREGRGLAAGRNKDGRIIGTLARTKHVTPQHIDLADEDGRPLKLVSAVCGYCYTLYLATDESESAARLAYAHCNHKEDTPLFLDIDGHNPILSNIHLFGGFVTAAAVDSEGSLHIVTEEALMIGYASIARLPSGEAAVSVACCNEFIVALGARGGVFEARKPRSGCAWSFEPAAGLDGADVTEVSGTRDHCLAVCSDGRVFGRGSNLCGELGLGEVKDAPSFTELGSLSGHRITSASAGSAHSLFVTSDGRVLACGANRYGELLLSTGPSESEVLLPEETAITGGATFCIAGLCSSAVFVGIEPPPHTPNMAIRGGSVGEEEEEEDLS